MRIFKRLQCMWLGHDWSKAHGFRNYPEIGATCLRCGKKT